eukprot:s1626_g5.t1
MREDNFLQKFHDLGSADEEKRCRAARGMTVALQGDRLGSEDLSYTIRRLVVAAWAFAMKSHAVMQLYMQCQSEFVCFQAWTLEESLVSFSLRRSLCPLDAVAIASVSTDGGMDQRAHHAAINKLDMELDEYMAFDAWTDQTQQAWLAEELGVRPSDLSFLQALPPALQRNICETFDSSGTKDGNTLERLEAYARRLPARLGILRFV